MTRVALSLSLVVAAVPNAFAVGAPRLAPTRVLPLGSLRAPMILAGPTALAPMSLTNAGLNLAPRVALPTVVAPMVAGPSVSLPLPAAPGISALAGPSAESQELGSKGVLSRATREVGLAITAGKPVETPLNALFDAAAGPSALDIRPPDGSEDRRINRALQALGNTPVGLSVYRAVYQKYGANLTIRVDDDRNASYDARVSRENGRPVLDLTESLVDNNSAEAVAAYIAREMADLYYEDFPVSAERGFLSYSVMVRAYAEMTNSDLSAYGYAWDTQRDQKASGTPVIQRYYGSWKTAVQDTGRGWGQSIQQSEFFRFIQTRDDSNIEPRSKLSLRQQYDRGLISRSQYNEMIGYFNSITRSEIQWISDSGRR